MAGPSGTSPARPRVQGAVQGGSRRGPGGLEAGPGRAQAVEPGPAGTQARRAGGRRRRPLTVSRRCRAGRGRVPGAGPCAQDGAAGPWMCSLRTTLWPTSLAICFEQRAGEQPQLGGPGGRPRLHGQLAVLQLDRAAVLGDLRADHPLPGAEDRRLGRRLLPAARLHQPVQHRAERLRVARVRPRAGVAAQPPPRPPARRRAPRRRAYAGARRPPPRRRDTRRVQHRPAPAPAAGCAARRRRRPARRGPLRHAAGRRASRGVPGRRRAGGAWLIRHGAPSPRRPGTGRRAGRPARRRPPRR